MAVSAAAVLIYWGNERGNRTYHAGVRRPGVGEGTRIRRKNVNANGSISCCELHPFFGPLANLGTVLLVGRPSSEVMINSKKVQSVRLSVGFILPNNRLIDLRIFPKEIVFTIIFNANA